MPARGEKTVRIAVTSDVDGSGFRIEAPAVRVDRSDEVTVRCSDARVARWLHRSLSDIAGLALADPEATGDRYLGAGPPWYLTLFGRDSLISASMLLAVDPRLAAGTLRALARRQGTRNDADAAEQPGQDPARAADDHRRPRLRPGTAARVLRHPRRDRRCGSPPCTEPGGGGCRTARSPR